MAVPSSDLEAAAALLAPVSLREFRERFWEQQPLLVRREVPPAAYDELEWLQMFPVVAERLRRRGKTAKVVCEGEFRPPSDDLPESSVGRPDIKQISLLGERNSGTRWTYR